MSALYQGVRVRVIRIAGRRSIIIWRNMQKRVNALALSEVQDAPTN